jgi:hypothetical protein
MKASRLATSATLALSVGILAAAAGSRDDRSTASSCVVVLDSEVCTWVVTEAGTPVELGATIPLALIEDVPTDVEMVWPPQELASVPLPEQAREALGVHRLGINWEAHGHPPATFLTEHFDFHFYSIAEENVWAIDCADESKPAKLPASYALPDIEVPGMGSFIGLCVPHMGMHALPAHDVHETQPFGASMVIGYYSGQPIFFEPMVSRALLLERQGFTLDMPAVRSLPAGVRYPTSFRADYVAGSDAYRLVFSGFGN